MMVRDRSSPLVVEVTRGGEIESRHVVDAVAADHRGRIACSWGDATRPVLPRSAIKPIQAVPLVITGGAERFELTDVELALACSSHDGQPDHVDALSGWLARIGLAEAQLRCGSHRPGHGSSARALERAGRDAGQVHNNCSGKHVGFLTVCRHLGYELAGYVLPDHPLQRDHVTRAVEDVCEVDLAGRLPGVDGCGIPVWPVPLDRLAAGWARLARHEAGGRLLAAMRSEPFYVAGSERLCTRLIRESEGLVVVKTGAEGVYCGYVSGSDLGVALKARDGARRAAEAAVAWMLSDLGAPVRADDEPVVNWAGTVVGETRVRCG